jgi:tetratricopeptide (TPR) repeat protein
VENKRYEEAEQVVGRNLELCRKLVDDFPMESELRYDLAQAYGGLGDLRVRTHKFKAAEQAFRQELILRQRLVTEFPGVAGYREDLADCHYRLGISLAGNGALDEAIAAYKAATWLVPELFRCHNNLGVAFLEKGALDNAIDAFKEAVQFTPRDTSGRPVFTFTYIGLATAFVKKGSLDEAIDVCKQAIRSKQDDAEAHATQSQALLEKGALDEAADAIQVALRLEPGNAAFHNTAGMIYQHKDDLDKALAAYKEAIKLKPDYPPPFANLGQALMEQGSLEAAEENLRRAKPLVEKLAHDRPQVTNHREGLAINLIRLSEVHRAAGRSQEAEKELEQAQDLLEKLAKECPKVRAYPHRMAEALSGRARLRRDCDDLAEARRFFVEALTRQRTALELGGKAVPYYRGRVAIYALELAETLLQLPQDPELTKQVEELLREAIGSSAGDRSAQNAVAWFLVTSPASGFRDPKQAVQLAERLVEQGPQRSAYRRTLGAALCGTEDWRGAVDALDKAIKHQNDSDDTARFYLAMALWRMGNEEEARAGYQRAVQWMEKHNPHDYALRPLRAQVAGLLNLK